MPGKNKLRHVSKRERELMDIIYRLNRATVHEIMDQMADPPSNPAVRSKLQVLVKKGLLTYSRDGARYVYEPTIDSSAAERQEIDRLVKTFYGGSVGRAFQGLFDSARDDMTEEELEKLEEMIRSAKKEKR